MSVVDSEYRLEFVRRASALTHAKQRILATRLGLGDGTGPRPSTRLVAYFVAIDDASTPVADLRAHMERRVPTYMVPGEFVQMPALPKGPNGKLDRQALLNEAPAKASGAEEEEIVLPSSDEERRLAAIWCDVLAQEQVGVHDNFFEIGGHSLLAVRMLGKIRDAFELDIPMDAIFEAPTIARLASYLDTVRWALSDSSAEKASSESTDEEIEL